MDVAEMNRGVVAQFRAGGPVLGMDRVRLLLLTTTGRRSGTPHTTPMMFHHEGDRLLVVASNDGAPRHPDWYHNLVADPRVIVEIGHRRYEADAVPATGPDRDRLWDGLLAAYSFFADHQSGIDRQIPMVVLQERA